MLGSRGGGFIRVLRGGREWPMGCWAKPCFPGMAIMTGGEADGGAWAYICCSWEADQVPCLGGSMLSCCWSCWWWWWRWRAAVGGDRGIWRAWRPMVVTPVCTGEKAEAREVESWEESWALSLAAPTSFSWEEEEETEEGGEAEATRT